MAWPSLLSCWQQPKICADICMSSLIASKPFSIFCEGCMVSNGPDALSSMRRILTRSSAGSCMRREELWRLQASWKDCFEVVVVDASSLVLSGYRIILMVRLCSPRSPLVRQINRYCRNRQTRHLMTVRSLCKYVWDRKEWSVESCRRQVSGWWLQLRLNSCQGSICKAIVKDRVVRDSG